MEAAEAKVQRVLEGSRQFLVPHYQRPYSWREEQWKTLWRDLVELTEDPDPKPHFVGSIVTSPARSIPEGVEKRLLIDGQQRLTTILVLLALIRDRARVTGADRLAEKVQDLITNRHDDGPDHFKLLPTQSEDPYDSDRDTFVRLVRGESTMGKQGIAAAYAFFAGKLRRSDAPNLEDLFRIIVAKLTLVSIVLDEKMKFGETIRETDVYVALKMRVDEDDVLGPLDHLKDLVQFAIHYETLLNPERAASRRIRERIEGLNRLEVTVAYPFLLSVMADHANGARTEDEVCAVLDILENVLIRRFVCGVPSHGLNKMFPPLYRQASQGGVFAETMKRILAANARAYPRDGEFRERLASARLYGSGSRREKTKLVLERLEATAGHKERVVPESLTIEHVMPQTLSDDWKTHLGASWEEDHDQLLHTLGNLTLTNYNSELSNAPYTEKRARFADSHVELNRYFGAVDNWTAQEIEGRAESLIDQAVGLWAYFGPPQNDAAEESMDVASITGTVPSLVRMRSEETAVQSWVDVGIATMEGILKVGDDEFQRVVEDLPKFVNRDATAFRRSSRLRRLSNGAYMETNMSAAAIHRACVQAVQIAGLGADDWVVVYDRGGNAGDVADVSERKGAYQDFFQKLFDQLREVQFTNARAAQPQSWYSFRSGVPGFSYSFTFASGGRIRSELYIDSGEQESNKTIFDALLGERKRIEEEFEEVLAWERLDHRRACRVACYHAGSIGDSPEKLEAYLRWAVEHLLRFKKVFGPRIKAVVPRPATVPLA